jgi:hypothetical protein
MVPATRSRGWNRIIEKAGAAKAVQGRVWRVKNERPAWIH